MAAVDRPVMKPRPVYLNLFAIRMPLPSVVSFLHRASGALLFLVGIPLVLWSLQRALESPESWAEVRQAFQSPLAKLITVALVWAFLHHLFAGIRHVLMDVHVGVDLVSARRSAALALVLAIVITLAIAVRLW